MAMDPFTAGFYDGQKHSIRTMLQLSDCSRHFTAALAFKAAAKVLAAELGMSIEEVLAEPPPAPATPGA